MFHQTSPKRQLSNNSKYDFPAQGKPGFAGLLKYTQTKRDGFARQV